MENRHNRVLSIDAGGIKGLYSILILDGLQNHFQLNVNQEFEQYIGTSIGAVIASALATGITTQELINQFINFKNDFNRGHAYLTDKLFSLIDYLFGKKKLSQISSRLFIPVYNFSNKTTSYFSNEFDSSILLADVLKAACSDIRVAEPFEIKPANELFTDAGFFAYDPVLFFLQSEQIELNSTVKILSIGCGLLENISSDLNIGEQFDLIYDTFLDSQFKATQFFFDQIKKNSAIVYHRISEYPATYTNEDNIEHIFSLAQKKLACLLPSDIKQFLME